MGLRAVARAETAPPSDHISKTFENPTFQWQLFDYWARAQVRARPNGARRYIILTIQMLFNYLVAIIAQEFALLDFFEILQKWKKIKNFQIFEFWFFLFHFAKFQRSLEERIFWLWLRPSSQKASKLSGECIDVHHLGARALPRALSSQTAALEKLDFRWFLKYGRAEARFPCAQPRARPYDERQWILLTI